MPHRKHEMSAVRYLQEAVRRRMLPSAFAGEATIAQPGSDRYTNPSEAHQIAHSIDALLTTAIPAGPEYNFQRLYALRAIRAKGLDGQDPRSQAGLENIRSVIDDIDSKRPQFNPRVSPETVVGLYNALLSYSGVKGGDPREFPPIGNLGHRYDEPVMHVAGDQTYRKIPGEGKHRASLKQINKLLDEIVPGGAYYNDVRQTVVDVVLADGAGIAAWCDRDKEIAAEKKRSGSSDFIPNSHHFKKKKVMDALSDATRPLRATLQPSKALSPESAVEIGRLTMLHHAVTTADAGADVVDQPAAKRIRLPDSRPGGVSQDIVAAVRREAVVSVRTNPVAREMAKRVAASLDDVLPPKRNNFEMRTRFLKALSEERDTWRPESAEASGHEALPFLLTVSHSTTLKTKADEVQCLVETIDDYHAAWRCQLRELPPETRPLKPRTDDATAPSLKKKQLARPRVSKLEKAGRAAGQQKLNFQPIDRSASATAGERDPPGAGCRSDGNSRGTAEVAGDVASTQDGRSHEATLGRKRSRDGDAFGL